MEHKLVEKCDKTISILVADDDKDTVELIKFGAQERGWSVDTAHNVKEIIDKVNEKCINVETCYSAIVADLHYFSNSGTNVPHLTGVSAAKSIRQVYKDIPIIFVTGFNTFLIEDEAVKYSNEILAKPFDLENLLDRVQYYIDIFGSSYDGIERRRKSINFTRHHRRNTDKLVKLNSGILDAITEVREDIAQQALNIVLNPLPVSDKL